MKKSGEIPLDAISAVVPGSKSSQQDERGLIVTNLPLSELKKRALVNPRARVAEKDADFSQWIRQAVPGFGT